MLTAAVVGFMCVSLGIAAEQGKKAKKAHPEAKAGKMAKDIFYVPDAQPTTAPSPERPLKLALRYTIMLQRQVTDVGIVPESFIFQKGDRFRLLFEGNATGYLYIFHKGTSGQGFVLFPDRRINKGKNQIPAHVQAIVPATGWFEFDEKPGTEELYIFYTPKRIAELEVPAATGVIQERVWRRVITTVVQRHRASVKAGKTKDIVYVEEGLPVEPVSVQPGTEVSVPAQPTVTYAATQTIDRDGFLIHVIKLNHR